MTAQPHEIYLASDIQSEDDGLLWRPILREVECQYRPTPLGPVKEPFRVVKDGVSDLDHGIVSLSEVADNFNDGAYENVQVVLADKPKRRDPISGQTSGGDHEVITKNNQGFVRKLKVEDGDKGAVLLAGFDITEPDTLAKMRRGTYASTSSGIKHMINKASGKEYDAALEHVSITNNPWIPGLGAQLSDDDDVVEVNLDAQEEIVDESTVVWREEESAGWLREHVQAALTALTQAAPQLADKVFFWVKDVSPEQSTALVVKDGSEGGGESFVVPYTVQEDSVSIAPGAQWTQTREVMVAAADELDDDQLRQRVQNALQYNLELGNDYVVEKVGPEDALVSHKLTETNWQVGWDLANDKIWLDRPEDWRKGGDVPERDDPKVPKVVKQAPEKATLVLSDETPRGRLADAQEQRAAIVRNRNQEVATKMSDKLNLDGLDLSDEQREELERRTTEVTFSDDERDELVRRRHRDRERSVEDKIKELGEIGLSDNPGILKYLRRVYLSDDGKPAAVLLADDDNPVTAEASVTELFDGFLALIKNQETGKINLSDQALIDGRRPADSAEGEVEKPLDDQLNAAADKLGLRVRKSRLTRAGGDE